MGIHNRLKGAAIPARLCQQGLGADGLDPRRSRLIKTHRPLECPLSPWLPVGYRPQQATEIHPLTGITLFHHCDVKSPDVASHEL